MICIAYPNSWNALAVGATSMLIGWACHRWAVFFVFTQRAICLIITSLIRVYATIGQRSVASAFELGTEAGVGLAFDFIRAIATIRFAIAKQ